MTENSIFRFAQYKDHGTMKHVIFDFEIEDADDFTESGEICVILTDQQVTSSSTIAEIEASARARLRSLISKISNSEI